MFTGIVEEIGRIESVKDSGKGRKFTISCEKILTDVESGDSIAVNGVCLTAVSFSKTNFSADAVEETVRKTTLGNLKQGSKVNLERALKAGGKLGGHFVQGHVDCTGKILSIEKRAESWIFQIGYPEEFLVNVIPQGSITIDGVSLTVAQIEQGSLFVSIIPYTYDNTIFTDYKYGNIVNLEFDMIGKYILNFIQKQKLQGGLTSETLRQLGY